MISARCEATGDLMDSKIRKQMIDKRKRLNKMIHIELLLVTKTCKAHAIRLKLKVMWLVMQIVLCVRWLGNKITYLDVQFHW